MSNITPTPPSHTLFYWKPWRENANMIESWMEWLKDVKKAEYSADLVGQYINDASKEQIVAINKLVDKVGNGFNIIGNKLDQVNDNLLKIDRGIDFLNRKVDLLFEEQVLTNILLQNISDLLRVPDSEKERQHSIEVGIKFFINASKDDDLFVDSLEAFLKAEQLMKQDYFVLHRIGMIYLYSEKHINVEKALDYFARAAKYASVEMDPNAERLASYLTKYHYSANSDISQNVNSISILTADSYEKAAFCSYILGDFEKSVNYQNKAVKLDNSPKNLFSLSKYQARFNQILLCIENLNTCIDIVPEIFDETLYDLDLINNPEVLKLLEQKSNSIVEKIGALVIEIEEIDSIEGIGLINNLKKSLSDSFPKKIQVYNETIHAKKQLLSTISINESNLIKLKIEIQDLINKFQNAYFPIESKEIIDSKIKSLINSLELTYSEMLDLFNYSLNFYTKKCLHIGMKLEGGIVFYIDPNGRNGLVAAVVENRKKALWAAYNGNLYSEMEVLYNTIRNTIQTNQYIGSGRNNTIEIVNKISVNKTLFFKKPFETAARICFEFNHDGFSDWYLPSSDELFLLRKNCVQAYIPIKGGSYWSSSIGKSFPIFVSFSGVDEEMINYYSKQKSIYFKGYIQNPKESDGFFGDYYVQPIRSF